MFSQALSLWLVALAVKVAATIDNSAEMATLESQAVMFVEGDYTITNVANGQSISYIESGQAWFPSTDDSTAAVVTFNQNPSGPYTRLSSNGGLQKCVSAQWGYDEAGEGIGADHAGVLYTCAVGSGADPHSTVEKTKQWWLFVPVANSSTTSNLQTDVFLQKSNAADDDSSDSSDVTPGSQCKKSKDWIRRHPLYVAGHYNHTECAPYLTHSQAIALNVTAEAGWDALAAKQSGSSNSDASSSNNSNSESEWTLANRNKRSILQRRRLQKRAADDSNSNSGADVNGGTFYIIALDHLADMETRALVGKATVIPGGSKGTVMDPWDEGNTLQQWTVTSAN